MGIDQPAWRRLRPSFMSVTYGAGGSTRERTHATVARLAKESVVKPAAHLTCVAAARREIDAIVQRLLGRWRSPHRRAARRSAGRPRGEVLRRTRMAMQSFGRARRRHQADRRFRNLGRRPIRKRHPESLSLDADIDVLTSQGRCRRRIARSRSSFSKTRSICGYLDKLRARGIDIPIVPGIVPMQNFKQTAGFAKRAGASVPQWLADRFEGLDDDPQTRRLVAATVAAEQVLDLVDHGVREFPFLHDEPRRSRLCDLPSSGASAETRARGRLNDTEGLRREATREAASSSRAETDPGARRRHGHDDPAAQIQRRRFRGERFATGRAICAATTIS